MTTQENQSQQNQRHVRTLHVCETGLLAFSCSSHVGAKTFDQVSLYHGNNLDFEQEDIRVHVLPRATRLSVRVCTDVHGSDVPCGPVCGKIQVIQPYHPLFRHLTNRLSPSTEKFRQKRLGWSRLFCHTATSSISYFDFLYFVLRNRATLQN